ncbi:MAG: putative transposase [Verrucomicrobiales bacterium]|jgi:putative transposase
MFQPFDPRGEVEVYFTNMPHWRQKGCSYFVNYRLADSIPKSILEDWEEDKRNWLTRRGYPIASGEHWKDAFLALPRQLQFEFQKCFNRELNTYLDGGSGSCALRNPRCSQVVVDGWEHFHEKRYELFSLVVMPNHVHLLLRPLDGHSLERILQSRKRQSSRKINELNGKTGQLWQKHSYDHIVRNEAALRKFEEYISDIPQKAGLKEGFQVRRFDWQSNP